MRYRAHVLHSLLEGFVQRYLSKTVNFICSLFIYLVLISFIYFPKSFCPFLILYLLIYSFISLIHSYFFVSSFIHIIQFIHEIIHSFIVHSFFISFSFILSFIHFFRRSQAVLTKCLPNKEEHIILIKLSDIQSQLYNTYINHLLESAGHLNPIKGFHTCTKV